MSSRFPKDLDGELANTSSPDAYNLEEDEDSVFHEDIDLDSVEDENDVRTYFQIPDNVGNSSYWSYVSKAGFAAAKECFEDSYDEGVSDAQAVSYLEDFAAPSLRLGLDVEESTEDVEVLDWAERIFDRFGNDFSPHPNFHISPVAQDVQNMYDKVRKFFEPGAFDQVVGIYSSGLPFQYAATTALDAEDVVLRYSEVTREDEEVKVTDTMENRMGFQGSDILVVDDIEDSGRTLRTVSEYILDKDPDSVTAMIGDQIYPKTVHMTDEGYVDFERVKDFKNR